MDRVNGDATAFSSDGYDDVSQFAHVAAARGEARLAHRDVPDENVCSGLVVGQRQKIVGVLAGEESNRPIGVAQ